MSDSGSIPRSVSERELASLSVAPTERSVPSSTNRSMSARGHIREASTAHRYKMNEESKAQEDVAFYKIAEKSVKAVEEEDDVDEKDEEEILMEEAEERHKTDLGVEAEEHEGHSFGRRFSKVMSKILPLHRMKFDILVLVLATVAYVTRKALGPSGEELTWLSHSLDEWLEFTALVLALVRDLCSFSVSLSITTPLVSCSCHWRDSPTGLYSHSCNW